MSWNLFDFCQLKNVGLMVKKSAYWTRKTTRYTVYILNEYCFNMKFSLFSTPSQHWPNIFGHRWWSIRWSRVTHGKPSTNGVYKWKISRTDDLAVQIIMFCQCYKVLLHVIVDNTLYNAIILSIFMVQLILMLDHVMQVTEFRITND